MKISFLLVYYKNKNTAKILSGREKKSYNSSITALLSISNLLTHIKLAGKIWSFIPDKLWDTIIFLLKVTAKMGKKLFGK